MGFGGVGGFIGSVASGLVGGLLNKHENEANRDFQTEMANTSISRKIKDLEANNLNKLLAVQGSAAGAPVPTAQPVNYDGAMSNMITAVSGLANLKKINAEADNINQDTNNKKQLEVSQRLDNILKDNDVNNIDFRNKILAAQTEQEFNRVINSALQNENLSKQNKALVVRTAQELWNLQRDQRDLGQTEEGLRDKHYSNVFGKEYMLAMKAKKAFEDAGKPTPGNVKGAGIFERFFKGNSYYNANRSGL